MNDIVNTVNELGLMIFLRNTKFDQSDVSKLREAIEAIEKYLSISDS